MSESDGITEAVTGTLRSVITAAGYAGQQAAQVITQRLQERTRLQEQQAREQQARYDAERSAARAQLAVVHRDEWWERAEPAAIANVWKTALEWRDFDQTAADAVEVIDQQVRQRHGVSPVEMDTKVRAEANERVAAEAKEREDYQRAREWARENDGALYRSHEQRMMGSDYAASDQRLREELVKTWRERTGQGETERAAARADERTAAIVLAEPAPSAAQVTEHRAEAEVLYDSAERRQRLADRLDAASVGPETKEARMLSDVSQGQPSRDAVVGKPRAQSSRQARTSSKVQSKSLSR